MAYILIFAGLSALPLLLLTWVVERMNQRPAPGCGCGGGCRGR